jgi:hypothetical protein
MLFKAKMGSKLLRREENGGYIVKHQQTGNTFTIVNTFAERFPRVEISPANSISPF